MPEDEWRDGLRRLHSNEERAFCHFMSWATKGVLAYHRIMAPGAPRAQYTYRCGGGVT